MPSPSKASSSSTRRSAGGNSVFSNAVLAEQIRKEKQSFVLNKEYHIGNANQIQYYPEKPNNIRPSDPAFTKEDEEFVELHWRKASLRSTRRGSSNTSSPSPKPTQSVDSGSPLNNTGALMLEDSDDDEMVGPMSREIGIHTTRLLKPIRALTHMPKERSDITKFNDAAGIKTGSIQ
eukprot:TRINITY_DN43149_c0_g1_i1.p1 TRINITY_DN43149_c0_g1~~TRINITY_DN43149_c0_g1_i1.p1  ORF type:complete len:177 (+),score=28.77 TRINITY_DN43149_c0_g1_i1:75-605(+)